MTERRATVRRRRMRRRTLGLSFVLPYAVVLVLFGLIPVAYGLYYSFQVTPVVGRTYTSLTHNYQAVLTDYRTLTSAKNVALYLVAWLPAMLLVVFTVALVMDARRTRLAAVTRFVSYLPGAVTGASAALLWLFMFTPGVSPVGGLLRWFVTGDDSLVRDGTLPLLLAVMGIAGGAGGWIVLLYSALTDISPDVLEAARLDGAGAWQTVLHVKLPLMRSYLAFILIVSLANGFQVFVEPQVIGAGAPGRIPSTWSLNQLVFSYASGQSDYGRASALSMVLLLVTLVAALVVIGKTRFYSEQDA